MTLDRKLRTSLFWMVGIGVQVYCVAEANFALALMTIPVWLLAWPMSMSARGNPLPKLALGLVALGLTIQVFAAALTAPEDFVAAVSRYIVWLQLLKLYDKREPGDVAQAMALSVFLVLGSCLTSNSMWLGVGLLVYTPTALWAITIYQLYAEESRVGAVPVDAHPMTARALGHLRRLGVVTGVVAAAVAVSVFVLMPRGYGEGFLGDVGVVDPTPVSGVPEEVRLGESGLITESLEEVLELTVTNEEGKNVGDALRPVYLRAMTLDEYSDGRWRQSRRLANARSNTFGISEDRPMRLRGVDEEEHRVEGIPVYMQHIRYLTRERDRVTAMNRPIRLAPEKDDRVRIRVNIHDITLLNASGRRLDSYFVWSQPDAPLIPSSEEYDWRYERGFEGTIAHERALEWIDEAGLERDPEVWIGPDDHEIARLIEGRLQNNFMYTLEMIAPEPGEDPIEMFLTRTRAGHCEYFASTMAAMLRSLGIDARVVTGYAATEFVDAEGLFVVRENQAHAWVEARTEENRWRTYDPSPIAEVETAHKGPTGIAATIRNALRAANSFWIDHVVGFDRDRQEDALGGQSSRLRAFFERLWPTPPEAVDEDEQMQAVREANTRTLIGAAIQVAGLVVGAFGASVGLIYLLRRLDGFLEGWDRRRAERLADPEYAARRRQSAFYRRYLKVLKRAGLAPGGSTPPMTHARRIERAVEGVSGDCVRLTSLYYRLRFGRRLLSEDELREAERLLARIRSSVAG